MQSGLPQELKRQLAAADRDELGAAGEFGLGVPAACRESLDWYRQPRCASLLYAACAAVVLWMMSLMLETAPAPSGGSHDSEAESLVPIGTVETL